MLAKATTAAASTTAASGLPILPPSPMSFKIDLQFSTPLPFPNANVRNWRSGRNNSGVKCRRKRRAAVLVVRAGYSRRPMETAGAYQLVDDETGEKLILWGGVDQEDRSIPSDEVLSWKPSIKDYFGEEHKSVRKGGRISGLSGSFGRLKAHRVRELIQKTHLSKQRVSGHGNDEKVVKDMVSSHVEPEVVEEEQWKSDDVRNRIVSRVSKSLETRAPMQRILTKEGMNHHDIAANQRVEDLHKFQSTSKKFHKLSEPNSVSRSSSSSLGGWGIVQSTPSFRSKQEDILQNLRKSKAGKEFFSRKSFRDLGCCDLVIDALRNQHFVRPSHIQAMAFTPVISGKSSIIADQSGSGKTLAYLLPIIQRLRQEEVQGLGKSLPQNPRVVILVPTAELASQVLRNCRSISKFGVPFRSMVATGGFRQKTQLESLQQDLDVLIATPGRFTFLIKEGFMQLTNLRCAVLDEVDILLKDEDFERALQSLMNSAPVTAQYLFVTATLPVDIYNRLLESFPDCELIMGPGMHRTSSGLEEVLVDCSGGDGMEKTPDSAFINKKSALLQLIEEIPVSKTIIFCNKIETCRKVENVLKRLDRKGVHVKVLPFHAALAQELRLTNMEEFCRAQVEDSSLFLVCTDRASRGIDFAGVDHVVLFDFPRDPSEYVRRVGRTARGAGSKGKAFVFVVGKQVLLAQRIIERNRKGHPLHDVPSIY